MQDSQAVFSLFIAIALMAESPVDLERSFERLVNDDELFDSIGNSAEQRIICVARLLRRNHTVVRKPELGDSLNAGALDPGNRCGLEGEVSKAAAAIRAKYPDTDEALAKRTAEALMGHMLFWAQLSQEKEGR